jgi:hypothetical protein
MHDKLFERFMYKTLELHRIKINKIEGGGVITNKQKSQIKYYTDNKAKVLNTYVGKSIANISYFFHFLNSHPELISVFDKDIIKILGLNISIPSKMAPITEMLGELVGEGDSDTFPEFIYRIQLLRIMQFIIEHKIDWIGRNLNNPPTTNDYQMLGMAIADFKRAEVWIGYYEQAITKIFNQEKKLKVRANSRTVIPKMKKLLSNQNK